MMTRRRLRHRAHPSPGKPRRRLVLLGAALAAVPALARPAAAVVEVVTTLPAYASIAQEVGGGRVTATSISGGDEDAHFVKPKPSFALMLSHADLFVTTGLDLEIWAPTLIDKSGNRTIREGSPGYVSASVGVPLLEVPASADRSAGDVHIFGNPHISTSPLNAKIIARNIAGGLERVDPGGAAAYRTGLERFEHRIDEALYGRRLVEILGAETLDPLARSGRLMPFLESQEYQGGKLVDLLGGWLGRSRVFRGRQIVAYHKNWIYFTQLFGLEIADYVEPKPGIPPSPQHVHKLVGRIAEEGIRVVLAASYFSSQKVDVIAERTGCRTVRVPLGPGGEGPADYLALVDLWVGQLAAAFSGS